MRAATKQDSVAASVDRRLPELYLLLALAVSTLLCFATAPFFTPDEPNQSCRAISLTHGERLAHLGPDESGAEIDTGALEAMEGINALRMDWERHAGYFLDRSWGPLTEDAQRALNDIRWSGRKVFVPFGNTAVYPPVLYLPAAVGWRLGEAAGLTIFESLRLARLLCAWTAVGLGWLALRVCAGGYRWMLLPFLLLPSTLFLHASSSQDALLLAVAALVAAMLSRPLAAVREFRTMELAVTAGLIALCATARPPYMAMALLLFLPAVELPGGGWRRFMPALAAFFFVLATCVVWRHLVAPLGIEWSDEADPMMQEAFLHSHPFSSAWTLVHGTAQVAADFAWRGLYVVGWNDLVAPRALWGAAAAGLVGLLLFGPGFPLRTWRGYSLLTLAILAAVFGISLAEYIIWTPPGLGTVYGVQPRYWLPLLPLVAMLVQGRVPWQAAVPRRWLLVGAAAMLAVAASTVPWMAAHAFYREGVGAVLRLNWR